MYSAFSSLPPHDIPQPLHLVSKTYPVLLLVQLSVNFVCKVEVVRVRVRSRLYTRYRLSDANSDL